MMESLWRRSMIACDWVEPVDIVRWNGMMWLLMEEFNG